MEELIVGFDYTIWANRQWVATLPKFPDPARAEMVLRHLSYWQRNWLLRASLHIEGKEIDLLEEMPVGEALEKGSREWQDFLLRHADQDVKYERTEGGESSMALHRVARQLIYHSTYHRGHLRGLAEAAHVDDFPDTDWIFYSVDPQRSR